MLCYYRFAFKLTEVALMLTMAFLLRTDHADLDLGSLIGARLASIYNEAEYDLPLLLLAHSFPKNSSGGSLSCLVG